MKNDPIRATVLAVKIISNVNQDMAEILKLEPHQKASLYRRISMMFPILPLTKLQKRLMSRLYMQNPCTVARQMPIQSLQVSS